MLERPSSDYLPLYEDEQVEPPAPSEGSVLWRSVALRHPVFEKDVGRNERAGALEDHIHATAAMRGELAELRLRANVDLKTAEDQWAGLVVSPTGKQSLKEAKTRARPQLAQKLKDAAWTVSRCSEEMARMDADYLSSSRAYTILTGS